jgi:hypothetical protein
VLLLVSLDLLLLRSCHLLIGYGVIGSGAGGAGAKLSKSGKLDMGEVLSEDLPKVSIADIPLTSALCSVAVLLVEMLPGHDHWHEYIGRRW